MSEFINFCFYDTRPVDLSELRDALTTACAEAGARVLDGDGESDGFDGLVGELEDQERVRRSVVTGGKSFSLIVYDRMGTVPEPPDQYLRLSVDHTYLEPPNLESSSWYEGFPAAFVDLVRELAVALDPVFVTSFVLDGDLPSQVLPTTIPLDLDRVPWLGVYSPRVLDQFGGKERVLDAPV